MYRRRRIRSGGFGSLRQSNSGKKEGLMTVRRERVCEVTGKITMSTLNLSYVIYRPDLIHSTEKKPLLFIHGGPSIPSDYLQPLSKTIQDRCVIFYDQIGCGNSSIPNDLKSYSIQNTVNDLDRLIHHLKLKEFHIYGHSFGGIIAFEYSKSKCESEARGKGQGEESSQAASSMCMDENQEMSVPKLLSMTLSSAPANLREVEEETKLLLRTLRPRSNSDCSDMSIDDKNTEVDSFDESALFQRTFVCRSSDGALPEPLQEAYTKRGTVWEGTDVIIDYVAQPLSNAIAASEMLPPTLLLRGEYDFVSEKYGFNEWKKVINHDSVVCQTLMGCAHYSMLENTMAHSMDLSAFLEEREKESTSSGMCQ